MTRPTTAGRAMMRFGPKLFGYESFNVQAYFWFTQWSHLSIGVHVCLEGPNVELHVPFGFFRVGRRARSERDLLNQGKEHG